MDLNAIHRDLVECQSQVLWERPASYLAVMDEIEEAAKTFMEMLPDERRSLAVDKFQRGIEARLRLQRKRWNGIEVYANTTMLRIEIQKSAVSLPLSSMHRSAVQNYVASKLDPLEPDTPGNGHPTKNQRQAQHSLFNLL